MQKNILKGLLFVIISLVLLIPAAAQQEDEFDDMFDEIETEMEQEQEQENTGSSSSYDLGITGSHTIEMPFPVSSENFVFSEPLIIPLVKNFFTLYYRDSNITLNSGWHLNIKGFEEENPRLITDVVPGENYIAWNTEWFKLSGGFQYFNWGTADGVNPTDNLNPRDYTNGSTVEKLPVFSIEAIYYPTDNISLGAVYIPVGREDIFPTNAAGLIPAELFDGAEVEVQSIAFNPESFVAAAKFNFFSSLLDFSASYMYDYDSFYTPGITYTSYLDKSLVLNLQRLHRIGLDTKITAGSLGFWGEACLSIPENFPENSYENRAADLALTAGLDFNWGPGDNFYTNLQYSGKYVPDFYNSFYTDYPGGQPDPMQYAMDAGYATEYLYRALTDNLGNVTEGLFSGIIMNQDFSFINGKIGLSLRGAYFFPAGYDTTEKTRLGSLVLQPELGFKPVEGLKISLAGNLQFAWMKSGDEVIFDDTDAIGMFRDRNNVSLCMQYTWDNEM